MADAAPESVTVQELFSSANLDADKPVMLRVRGEVFPCEPPSIVWHEGRYVLMLDGVTSD